MMYTDISLIINLLTWNFLFVHVHMDLYDGAKSHIFYLCPSLKKLKTMDNSLCISFSVAGH